MAAARLVVSCRSCRRAVALVPDIDDAALNVLATHLRCLHPDETPGELRHPRDLLHRFRVAAAEPRWHAQRAARMDRGKLVWR
jgi:hypothetical protein